MLVGPRRRFARRGGREHPSRRVTPAVDRCRPGGCPRRPADVEQRRHDRRRRPRRARVLHPRLPAPAHGDDQLRRRIGRRHAGSDPRATFTEADRVQTSHPLRTLHRVLVPYHGLPGKNTALRTVFAAAELTQAKVLVVIDPSGPATSPERVTELIAPIVRADVEFLAPRYRRHPRDGILVTQLVRPLVRALYSIGLDEPLGAEFGCSGRFASHCLEQDIWNQESARFAIDLWLRTEAAAERFPVGQIGARRPRRRAAAPRCARSCTRSSCRWSRAFACTSRTGSRQPASPSCVRGASIRRWRPRCHRGLPGPGRASPP